MDIVALIKSALDATAGVAKAVEVRTTPLEVQLMDASIGKERLTIKSRVKVLNEAARNLRKFKYRRSSVDAYCEVAFDSLDDDDKQDLKQALYELFPKRKHKK
jgi:hypothetical protein